MFKVENADFIANKLAAELLPDQEYREAYKNAEEAVVRRRNDDVAHGRLPTDGRVEFDVDWAMRAHTGNWYLACADNGDGMTRREIEKYTTTLAVTGANQNQSLTGNQGMGLKISGPTRHPEGVLIRSLKNGERSMVQIGWNGHEYGLIPLNAREDTVVPVDDSFFPNFILEQGSGTVVTFLGAEPGANTVVPGNQKNWLFKYLHRRFFRLDGGEVELLVRQPAKDPAEWPATREDADALSGFNLAGVRGTGTVWDTYADKLGEDKRGVVDLPGTLGGVPSARMHWWILPPSGPGNDISSRTVGGGSLGVLFQNELHDWRIGGQANPYFARLGVIFGKSRIAFVVEPQGNDVSSDFARAHVLVGGKPVFDGDAFATWADQFRDQLPEAIKSVIVDEQSRLQEEDPDRAKRIRDRLKDVMHQLRPRRVRRNPTGTTHGSGPDLTGPGPDDAGDTVVTSIGPGKRETVDRKTQGIGAALAQAAPDDPDAESASEILSILKLTPRWVTEKEAAGLALVQPDEIGLRDRAAALAGEDGSKATDLLLNREFRGYQMLLQATSEWANPDGDLEMAAAIEQHTQEWVEQKMIEAVTGLRQLENGNTWTPARFDSALSPVALTAAFMADRYHTMAAVRRQIGPLRTKRS